MAGAARGPHAHGMSAPMLRVLLAAVALRVALVVVGLGRFLMLRVEASTPANSLLTVREGLALLRMGIPPYAGSACHVPPLLLWLLGPTAPHAHLYALPGIVCDVLAALLLRRVAAQLMQRRSSPATPPRGPAGATATVTTSAQPGPPSRWVTPDAIMALYLLNPFTVAACISGTTSPLEALAVIGAVWRAAARDAPGAAFGVAAAAYAGVHHIFLVVRLPGERGEGGGSRLHA